MFERHGQEVSTMQRPQSVAGQIQRPLVCNAREIRGTINPTILSAVHTVAPLYESIDADRTSLVTRRTMTLQTTAALATMVGHS